MRARLGDLRRVLREDYLHGVPEWALREDTRTYVDRIRQRITSYILANKSEDEADRREAIAAMNDACSDLEEKIYAVLEGCLWSFTRRV